MKTRGKARAIDYLFKGHGSVWLVYSTTKRALKHLREHVQQDAQWMGEALAVEWRYVGSLANALKDDGFTVNLEALE